MLVNQVFEAWLFPDPLIALNDLNYPFAEGENITEGILNVDITSGTDIYEGPQQQIDVGQFTIVSRNPNLDPKINPNLKYDSTIKFYDTRTGEFFRGFVTDIQVEYQREDNPIITITGTDIFGAMQRVVVSQATHDAIKALSTGPTWSGITFTEFMPYMAEFTFKYLEGQDAITPPGYPQPYGFWFPASGAFGELSFGNLFYSPAKYIPEVGETYLDVVTKYAQTNLSSFNPKSGFGGPMDFNFIGVNSFVKYDPNYWPVQEDPNLTYLTYDFSSDPADDKSYESILIDNGYNRVINQLDISNESRYVDAGEVKSNILNFTRTSDESIENYAISAASVSTIYPEDAVLSESSWANRYSQNIFQVAQFPAQEIKQITFNNARAEMIEDEWSYSDYSLDRLIRIKHQINNDQIIDRLYNIAGISHNISVDKWEMTFTFKPSKEEIVFNYQDSQPSINMNAITGDTNFNFTATVQNINPDSVTQILWVLNGSESNAISSIFPYADGNMFKDNQPRTGFTQTWNFDDDGILAPYSFDPDSTPTNPIDNRYGGYGPGIWTVYAFIFLTNRFVIALEKTITVGTPAVQADFGWAQNLTNNFGLVSFTDTSVNNETGEPDSYLWNFGDGTTSTEKNPIKVYDPSGPSNNQFNVSLTVFAYGPGGTKVYNTKTETITLTQPTMTPDFTWVANYQVVTFTNTSTNVGFEEPDAYLWDFGDGNTSTLKNPTHTFPVTDVNTPQSFSVTLTTRNIWEQTASITKTVTTTALNKSGTYPVRYIKLRIDPYTKPGSGLDYFAITPQFYYLRARTSNTLENLTNTAQLLNFQDIYLPLFQQVTVSGDSPQTSLGLGGYLTRLSSNTVAMGCGSAQSNMSGDFKTVRAEYVLQIPTTSQHLINDIIMRATTLYKKGGPYDGFHPESFYPKIYVDVATSIGGYTPNPSGTFGPPTLNGDWVNIGYFKFAGGDVPTADYTMTALRPLPLNIPYFLYTFNDKTASFTSVETADSYAWNFGDGTTSTLKNPIKTYAAYGTYNVTLAVTNGGVVTRTTTEPVIVEPPVL